MSDRRERSPSVEDLDPTEAREVLLRLWRRDGPVRVEIRAEIERYLGEIEIEDVADRVFDELNALSLEELWDRSGRSHRGYAEPAEVSWEMVQDVIDPFLSEMERYSDLGMNDQAFRCCVGVLEGLYTFEHESTSDFKKWAWDDPREAFGWVLNDWKRAYRSTEARGRMEDEVARRCPEWA